MAGHIPDSADVSWRTPRKILDPVDRMFHGPPALDPCSNPHSLVRAHTEYMLPNQDGLVDSWDFPTIYVNPPFGKAWYKVVDGRRQYVFLSEYKELEDRQKADLKMVDLRDWMARCSAAAARGSEVIALVPAYVDTRAWQDEIWRKAAAVCFPRGRIKFLLPPDELGFDKTGPAPMACALVYWGSSPNIFMVTTFHLGKVVLL